jgi:hypothetical protein
MLLDVALLRWDPGAAEQAAEVTVGLAPEPVDHRVLREPLLVWMFSDLALAHPFLVGMLGRAGPLCHARDPVLVQFVTHVIDRTPQNTPIGTNPSQFDISAYAEGTL